MNIDIENLTFAWRDEPIFKNVSISLESGDIVLLSGENGSGKTTLLKLMCGMIPHFSRGKSLHGDISINSISIITEPPKFFFPNIAFIPNYNLDFFLLNQNLEEELLIIQALMKLSTVQIYNKISRFKSYFHEYQHEPRLPFSDMSVQQKIMALSLVYYIQGASIYLIDEIFTQFTRTTFYHKWKFFLTELSHSGCSIIYISHNMSGIEKKVWNINNKTINCTIC